MVERNLYVDNVFLMGGDVEQLRQWCDRLCGIFDENKMHVREFLADEPSITQGLLAERVLPRKETKTLGLWWDPVADTYTVRFATGGELVERLAS